jgi:hypothetical protein
VSLNRIISDLIMELHIYMDGSGKATTGTGGGATAASSRPRTPQTPRLKRSHQDNFAIYATGELY